MENLHKSGSETPVLLFHPGKQHSPQTALALQQLGRLRYYATSIFYDPARFPYYLEKVTGPVGRKLHSEFSRFEHPEIDPVLVRTWGTFEWLERAALRLGAVNLAYRLDHIGNRRFSRGLSRDIASDARFALWGYNGSAVEAFRLAKSRGRICILDRTIGDFRYYNRVIAEQAAIYPQFFTGEEPLIDDRRIALDDEEYALADRIVVGSQFCRQTIVDSSPVPGIADKIDVLPYCCNNHDFRVSAGPPRVPREGPVKFLFVGRISQRKGIHLLLEAIARFDRSEATLTLLGKMLIPKAAFAPYADRVMHVPSVTPGEVSQIMGEHHVLVLPSFFEGSAITLLEALSCGMAIIQSPQAGNGASAATGIVLAANTADDLEAAMRQAVDDRERIGLWRANAQLEAKRYDFGAYRDNVAALLARI